jgi:hypothetical protein
MTIEVTGWFAFLLVLDCSVSFDFFFPSLSSGLLTRFLFTFLILSLDLGVACAFIDTNGLCDDSMRGFFSSCLVIRGSFIVLPSILHEQQAGWIYFFQRSFIF